MSAQRLRKKLASVLVLMFLLCQSGCVYLVVGGIGVLGGYAVSPDTVEGMITGRSSDEIWDAAVETVSVMGILQEKNEMAGVLIGRVQGAHVTVTLTEPVHETVKLQIKARKGFMPKIKLASEIYAKISERMTR